VVLICQENFDSRNGSDGRWYRPVLDPPPQANSTTRSNDIIKACGNGCLKYLPLRSPSRTAHIDIPPEDGVPARQSQYADPRLCHSCVGIRRRPHGCLNVLRFCLTLFLNELRLRTSGCVLGATPKVWTDPCSCSRVATGQRQSEMTSAASAASYLQR
jgi:hypothetical protein